MRKTWRKVKMSLAGPGSDKAVPIVADAAIATRIVGEGRLIPLLILDSTERPDVVDLVKMQQILPPGDITSQWGLPDKVTGKVYLVLRFERPSAILIILEFDVLKQGILVESILTAKALYLQPGRQGDRISGTLDNPRMLVEILAFGINRNGIACGQK